MENVDFGKTHRDYRRYRAGFPPELFDRLASLGIGCAGQRILDVGTGTGTMARQLAQRGAEVIGLDRSAELMGQARELDREAGVHVDYVQGRAEDSGLPSESLDVVTAGQCWHWFERSRAAREMRRLLRPGGRIVIAHFDWIPVAGNVVEATEKLIEEFSPEWPFGGGSGLYPAWFGDLSLAGFEELESFSFDRDVPYTHEAWRGRVRASAGVAASLPPREVDRFDQTLGKILATDFPDDPLSVPHRVWALIGKRG